MAYIKRSKYTIIDNDELKKELLDLLEEKDIKSVKARELVYYPRPMSLIRWAKYLDPEEIKIYLQPYEDEDIEDEEFGF